MDAETKSQEKDLRIVFSPLHGTAHDLVPRGLEQLNFTEVSIVAEQAEPDQEFSTVESPNPEEGAAFALANEQGHKQNAEILIATDSDADWLGVAVKDADGEYL